MAAKEKNQHQPKATTAKNHRNNYLGHTLKSKPIHSISYAYKKPSTALDFACRHCAQTWAFLRY